MPANLTQQYLKAEDAYRHAATPEEELRCLQVMLQEIPKHKGTDHLQAQLKAKIASVKKDIDVERASGKKGGPSLRIPRQGAGTAIVIGGPNAGKSQLLRSMTKAQPEVAVYPFTTKIPSPGMMPWEDVFVQLIDTPPITRDYVDSYTYGLIRASELALLMIDLGNDDGIDDCIQVLQRLQTSKTRLGAETQLDEDDIGVSYTRTFLVFNKTDDSASEERYALFWELLPDEYKIRSWTQFRISAETSEGIEDLRNAIYHAMNVVRVYTKLPTKKEADRDRPFTVRQGETLLDLAALVHKDYAEKLKYAKVWGSEVHDGTPVKGDYILNDGDVVELHL